MTVLLRDFPLSQFFIEEQGTKGGGNLRGWGLSRGCQTAWVGAEQLGDEQRITRSVTQQDLINRNTGTYNSLR